LPSHLPPVRCALLCTVLGAELSQQVMGLLLGRQGDE
jgi:hypothetical protein